MTRRVHIGHRSLILASILTLIFAASVPANDTRVSPGEIFASDELGSWAEAFQIPTEIAAALAATALGDTIVLESFPIAPGQRARLELERYEVFAPGARLVVVDATGERELPRPERLHFLGSVAGDPETRVGLSFDPTRGHLRGDVNGPLGELRILEPSAADFRHRIERVEEARASQGVALESKCSADDMPLPDTIVDHLVWDPGAGIPTKGVEPTHTAVIAVDTDEELLDKKFSNDTGAASTYISDLITQMNVFYERDVGLRLLLGDTTLRPGNPPYTGDPWNQTGTTASSAHLSEFGTYWSANMGSVERVFAMLLSGKSAASNSASGIAWVDGYCENQSGGGGYSVTMVFVASFSSAGIVGHELGHNAGSPHTHCYSPPVDQCYNAEGGCYTGTPSCPGGPGTVMSYCNFGGQNGANCGQNQTQFHPTVVTLFDGFIASHSPGCVVELTNDEIFSDGFESGNVTAWGDS